MTEIIEGDEYEVAFQSGSNSLVLKVILSPEFPKNKPVLKIVPNVIHPWVSSDGDVTSAPGLLNVSF